MMASYTVNGESFRADNSTVVAETRTLQRPRQRSYALHPDGERFAMAPLTENTATTPDKVVFVFNFFDELHRIAPPNGPND